MEAIRKFTLNISVAAILIMAVMEILEIFARSFFNFSFLVVDEFAGYLMSCMVFMGLANSYHAGSFVRVEALYLSLIHIFIDPSQNIDEVRDILVKGNKIVETPKDGKIDPQDVKEVINCNGYYVFPGLVDNHAHFSWNFNNTGVQPDLYTLPSGVTSVHDAGSCGSSGFEAFIRTTILPSLVTMKASINVASGGLCTPQYMENIEPENFDEKGIEELFDKYPQYIYGLKLRLGKDISDGMGVEPLKAAVKLARKFDTRLSVHATYPLTPISDIVDEMGEGDVLCHTFQKMGPYNILDENGKVLKEVWEARDRGVIFDCAHGRIHCCFPLTKAAIEQGLSLIHIFGKSYGRFAGNGCGHR